VGASHAVTVIIVVCVGFLLFMIVLGVIRIRAAHQRSQQEDLADAEMAWDDSALNITVNPMEVCMDVRSPPLPFFFTTLTLIFMTIALSELYLRKLLQHVCITLLKFFP
jgi:hypothetical protein